eukprot:m.434474 g.434474  ORF g.434474 m.434474 type:complete len:84 (+) comp17721_c0_seq1:2877-3128(+)
MFGIMRRRASVAARSIPQNGGTGSKLLNGVEITYTDLKALSDIQVLQTFSRFGNPHNACSRDASANSELQSFHATNQSRCGVR